MENEKVRGTNCCTCGAGTSARQCAKCGNIGELLEQLIRKQLRAGGNVQNVRGLSVQHGWMGQRLRLVHSHGRSWRAG